VFFGVYNPVSSHELSEASLKKIEEALNWEDSAIISLADGDFAACFQSNSENIPSPEDIRYLDKETGTIVILDGFIYNTAELLLNLPPGNLGHLPELVFRAFMKWGDSFADHLNGDFAICIYQKAEHKISFFRDHVGIRPLAVLHEDRTVYFSTDPIGLCKALNNSKKTNPDFLLNLFLNGGHNYHLLPYKKVEQVPAGHSLHFGPAGRSLIKFWFPEKIRKEKKLTLPRVLDDLALLLSDAVAIRSDKKFRASAHVSGGLDSGLVAAMARNEYSHQDGFYGFSWSPDYPTEGDPEPYDERVLVKELCKRNNIIPLYTNFTSHDHLSQMQCWHYPSELVFENRVAKMARSKGVNLIFSGWGGDEFVSIGHRGVDADLIREFSWRSLLQKYPVSQPGRLVRAVVFNFLFPYARRSFARLKASPEIYLYIKSALGSNILPSKKRFKYRSRRAVHLQLLTLGHLSARATDWYIHGQHLGIEYRYPLLDKRIIEYMLKVPSRCFVGGNDYRIVLRFLAKDLLPESVINNKSKDDPVKSHFIRKFWPEINELLIGEVDEYRTNPELHFIDFNLLRNDLDQYKITHDEKLADRLGSILYYIKTAHEFSKAFRE